MAEGVARVGKRSFSEGHRPSAHQRAEPAERR